MSASSSSAPEKGPVDPIVLARKALVLLEDRMVENPSDIPSGQLIALARDLAKVELARLQSLPPEETKADPSVADILALDGLPRQRRLELLRQTDARLGAEHAKIQAAIEELESEPPDGQAPGGGAP